MAKASYKAIVSDFDGTLVGEDGNIPEKVRGTIRKWKKAGNCFSFATGRQYRHIEHECKALHFTAPQIARGGAEIVEAQTGKILHAEYLNSRELKSLIKILKKGKIPFTAERGDFFYTLTGEPIPEVPEVKFKKITQMPYEGIAKILLWSENFEENFVEEFVENGIGEKFPSVEIVKSYTPFLKTWTITSKRGTKHLAVLRLAELLNIDPHQMVGVGDN